MNGIIEIKIKIMTVYSIINELIIAIVLVMGNHYIVNN